MTVDGILELLKKLLDVLIVWLVLYYILKNIRKNVKMVMLFKGVLFILILKIFSDLLNLTTINYLLDYVITWGPLALIIIFQPEIRNVLEQLGVVFNAADFSYLNAIDQLRKNRIGALIVIERYQSLSEYIEKSKKIYADISNELLITLFFPNNPLHDGGVIIQGDKITSAGAVFPTSDNLRISKRLGTRHRAALGIAEESDCISLIVSEETGRLSMAFDSELHYNLSVDELKIMLLEELRPKKILIPDDEGEQRNEENN